MEPWFDTNYAARVITEEKLFETYRKIITLDGRRSLPSLLESLLGIIS